MKLSLGGEKSPEDKKNMIVAGVAIVVILLAVFLIARNFMGGGGGAPTEYTAPGPGGTTGPAPPGGVGPGGVEEVEPGAPPIRQAPSAEPGARPAPQAAPQPAQQPAATPPSPAPTQPAATAPGPPAAQTAPKPSAAPRVSSSSVVKDGMRQIKVFGSVSISYPAKWKINTGGGNRSAEFTNGTASFQVHAPDPRATSAKAIAQAALKSLAKGAAVTAQGTDKVAGNDAYWMAVKVGGTTARIVGIDGPTRIALYEVVKTGSFAGYRDTFNKMQSRISFGK